MVAHHRRFTPRRGGVGGRHVRNRDAAGGRPRLPDPHGLAAFYRELVGGEITHADDEWVSLRDGGDVSSASSSRPTTSRRCGPARTGPSSSTST
jgi:hypothetical protein